MLIVFVLGPATSDVYLNVWDGHINFKYTILYINYNFLQDIVRYCIGCYSRTCGQSRSKWTGQDWTPLFQATQEVAFNMTLQQLIDG